MSNNCDMATDKGTISGQSVAMESDTNHSDCTEPIKKGGLVQESNHVDKMVNGVESELVSDPELGVSCNGDAKINLSVSNINEHKEEARSAGDNIFEKLNLNISSESKNILNNDTTKENNVENTNTIKNNPLSLGNKLKESFKDMIQAAASKVSSNSASSVQSEKTSDSNLAEQCEDISSTSKADKVERAPQQSIIDKGNLFENLSGESKINENKNANNKSDDGINDTDPSKKESKNEEDMPMETNEHDESMEMDEVELLGLSSEDASVDNLKDIDEAMLDNTENPSEVDAEKSIDEKTEVKPGKDVVGDEPIDKKNTELSVDVSNSNKEDVNIETLSNEVKGSENSHKTEDPESMEIECDKTDLLVNTDSSPVTDNLSSEIPKSPSETVATDSKIKEQEQSQSETVATNSIIKEQEQSPSETVATDSIVKEQEQSPSETVATDSIVKEQEQSPSETVATDSIIKEQEQSPSETVATDSIIKEQERSPSETVATDSIIKEKEQSPSETVATDSIIKEEEQSPSETVATDSIIKEQEQSPSETVATDSIIKEQERSPSETVATDSIIMEQEPSESETLATDSIIMEQEQIETEDKHLNTDFKLGSEENITKCKSTENKMDESANVELVSKKDESDNSKAEKLNEATGSESMDVDTMKSNLSEGKLENSNKATEDLNSKTTDNNSVNESMTLNDEPLTRETENKLKSCNREDMKLECKEDITENVSVNQICELSSGSDVGADVEDEINVDLKDEVKSQLKDGVKSDLIEEVKSDLTDKVISDIKEDLKQDFKSDIQDEKDLKEKIKSDLKEEVKSVLKEEVKSDLKDEVKSDLTNKVISDVKEEVKEDVKSNLTDKVFSDLKDAKDSIDIKDDDELLNKEDDLLIKEEKSEKAESMDTSDGVRNETGESSDSNKPAELDNQESTATKDVPNDKSETMDLDASVVLVDNNEDKNTDSTISNDATQPVEITRKRKSMSPLPQAELVNTKKSRLDTMIGGLASRVGIKAVAELQNDPVMSSEAEEVNSSSESDDDGDDTKITITTKKLNELVKKRMEAFLESKHGTTVAKMQKKLDALYNETAKWKSTAAELSKHIVDLTALPRSERRKAAAKISTRDVRIQVDESKLQAVSQGFAAPLRPNNVPNGIMQKSLLLPNGAILSPQNNVTVGQIKTVNAMQQKTVEMNTSTTNAHSKQINNRTVRDMLNEQRVVTPGVPGSATIITSPKGNTGMVVDLTEEEDNSPNKTGPKQQPIVLHSPPGGVRPSLVSASSLPGIRPGTYLLQSGPRGGTVLQQLVTAPQQQTIRAPGQQGNMVLGSQGGAAVLLQKNNQATNNVGAHSVLRTTLNQFPPQLTPATGTQVVGRPQNAPGGQQNVRPPPPLQSAPNRKTSPAKGVAKKRTSPALRKKNAIPVDDDDVLITTVTKPQPAKSHPAPLPPMPTSQSSGAGKKQLPPKPTLKISRVAQGIVLSWNMTSKDKLEEITNYQLFAYQEGQAAPTSLLWKKVGDVKALPLPMACTLTQFQEGNKYHFAVRAMDKHLRVGPFSEPSSIHLTSKS